VLTSRNTNVLLYTTFTNHVCAARLCTRCLRNKRISDMDIFPGSAEADLRWCGNLNGDLMASYVGNIRTKNYRNLSIIVQVINDNVRDLFWDTAYRANCVREMRMRMWCYYSVLVVSSVNTKHDSCCCCCWWWWWWWRRCFSSSPSSARRLWPTINDEVAIILLHYNYIALHYIADF